MDSEIASKFTTHGKKIFGVGKNYRTLSEHEGDPHPAEPVIFLKPPSSYITEGQNIKLQNGWKTIEHEVELGVVIGKTGFQIPSEKAMDYVAGYCLGLDMTARHILDDAGPMGLAVAKGFDTSCPVSEFIPKEKIKEPHHLDMWLKVNSEIKQYTNTSHMVFHIPQIISYLSKYFTLEPGDLILTGTPEGQGPVKSGDVIESGLQGLMQMHFTVE